MKVRRLTKELRFGLSYMGSKSRLWKWLTPLLPRCSRFYDVFAGGCSVGHMMMHFGRCDEVIFNDLTASPLRLFTMAMDRKLPDPLPWMSSEEFRERCEADDPLTLLFSFGSGGKGYFCSKISEPWRRTLFFARQTGDYSEFRKYAELKDMPEGLPVAWARQHVTACNQVAAKMAGGAEWPVKPYKKLAECIPLMLWERLIKFDEYNSKPFTTMMGDYRDAAASASAGDLIYADPPYQGTEGYKVGKFDHMAFWEWARSPRPALLLISEYNAPPDFVEVGVKTRVCTFGSKPAKAQEKLFVHRSQLGLWQEMSGTPSLPLIF